MVAMAAACCRPLRAASFHLVQSWSPNPTGRVQRMPRHGIIRAIQAGEAPCPHRPIKRRVVILISKSPQLPNTVACSAPQRSGSSCPRRPPPCRSRIITSSQRRLNLVWCLIVKQWVSSCRPLPVRLAKGTGPVLRGTLETGNGADLRAHNAKLPGRPAGSKP